MKQESDRQRCILRCYSETTVFSHLVFRTDKDERSTRLKFPSRSLLAGL